VHDYNNPWQWIIMASMSNTSIQLPTELWDRIMRFHAHPCADLIRKLKDDLASNYPEEFVLDLIFMNKLVCRSKYPTHRWYEKRTPNQGTQFNLAEHNRFWAITLVDSDEEN